MTLASRNKLVMPIVEKGAKDPEFGDVRSLSAAMSVRSISDFPSTVQDVGFFVGRITPFADALLAKLTSRFGNPHFRRG